MIRHIKDTDCTVDPETGYGVDHGEPCEECGRRAFHAPGCRERIVGAVFVRERAAEYRGWEKGLQQASRHLMDVAAEAFTLELDGRAEQVRDLAKALEGLAPEADRPEAADVDHAWEDILWQPQKDTCTKREGST